MVLKITEATRISGSVQPLSGRWDDIQSRHRVFTLQIQYDRVVTWNFGP